MFSKSCLISSKFATFAGAASCWFRPFVGFVHVAVDAFKLDRPVLDAAVADVLSPAPGAGAI